DGLRESLAPPPPNSRSSPATNASASSVRISSNRDSVGPRTSTTSGWVTSTSSPLPEQLVPREARGVDDLGLVHGAGGDREPQVPQQAGDRRRLVEPAPPRGPPPPG